MGWLDLTEKEYQAYDNFVLTHGCVSQREIRIVPDGVAKGVKVRCFKCGKTVDITDWESA